MTEVSVGDRVLYHEDNTIIPVEVVNIEDVEREEYTDRRFTLRALENQNEPHYISRGTVSAGETFEVGVNLKYLDSPYRGWRFSERAAPPEVT